MHWPQSALAEMTNIFQKRFKQTHQQQAYKESVGHLQNK